MLRRDVLTAGGAALLATALRPASAADGDVHADFAPPRPRVAIDARPDRVIDVAVCTRPFRAQGPRIESERAGSHTIVHNYGHGGSGWSLSWGSADVAVRFAAAAAAAAGPAARRLAVIGCGAIGLTTALTAQRAGFRVRIYASERPPEVRSSNATGVWSPDSRICTTEHATPAFAERWEAMARRSFWVYQRLLGLAGSPVEWRDMYVLSDVPFDRSSGGGGGSEPDYPELESERLGDLHPRSRDLPPNAHPFPVAYARLMSQMTFNIAAYTRMLVADFEAAGGEIVTRTFAHPREFRGLPERIVVNATGYGARALLNDDTIVPVRGQTARLVPQPEVDYGLYWRGHNLAVVPRRDGILVQAQAEGDFGNPDVTVDRAATDAAVARLATLFDRAPRVADRRIPSRRVA